MSLFATILFALTISTFSALSKEPEILFCMEYASTNLIIKSFVRFMILLLFLFIPALILNAVDVIKEAIHEMTKYSKASEEVYEKFLRKLHILKNLQRKLMAWLKAELGTEIIYQVLIQLILLMMFETQTPTQRGLDAIFAKSSAEDYLISSQIFLIFSIIWSLKTCITTHVKAAKVEKDFLPFTSTLILLAQTSVATLKRIGIMFFYFTPFFGNLNLLQHWKAELKPWKAKPYVNYKEDILYIGNVTLPWSTINRADYTDRKNPTPPTYTEYTGLSLGEAYLVFLLLICLQVISVFLCKLYTAEQFKRKGLLQKILHSLENCSFVSPAQDWDMETGDIEAHWQRIKQVKVEVIITMFINFLWHVAMLFPLLYTGNLIILLQSST